TVIMNVLQQNIDSVNAIVKIQVEKADYQERVEKSLRSFRQKANIPGFRKGMAPMGMIRKMYQAGAEGEEINKLVTEALFGHIRENKLELLGEPLPNTTVQKPIDYSSDEAFEFCFDIALAPEININLSAEDCVDYYTIDVNEELVNKQIEMYAQRTGTPGQFEIVEDRDMVKGNVVEIDAEGNAIEGGLTAEGSVIMPSYFKNEEAKAAFLGKKLGDVITFVPQEVTGGNEYELSHILKIEKEEAKNFAGTVSFTITEITRQVPHAIDQELFDTVFGAGVCSSEEEFRAKTRETISAQMTPDQDYKFWIDARQAIMNKVGELTLPTEFLKRWLLATDESKTAESVDAEYPQMINELSWHLTKEAIAKSEGIKVEEADLQVVAEAAVKAQFAQYGMPEVPAEMLKEYSAHMLKDEKSRRNLIEQAVENKIRDAVKAKVSLNNKTVTVEEFNAMFQQA
ncbi:MAG: trigger factor, partial [Bacteroidales bacterium]